MSPYCSRKMRWRKFLRPLTEEESKRIFMRRVIWSAFALSLTLIPSLGFSQTESVDDFLGLESEVMPDLEGPQRFTPTELYDKPEWNVEVEKTILDKEPLKGQDYSIIPWKGIDPEGFLNIDYWIADRDLKDKTPDWKIRLRDQRHMELVGKVLKCVGTCPVFRGTEKASVEYLSRIREGDEFRTEADSYAWIYLMDGSLLRLGARTSVSFQEMLVSPEEIFFAIRLNTGHAYWHPRPREGVKAELDPETDSVFYPLMLREANLEWYERKRYEKQSDREHLDEVLEFKTLAIKAQVERLNELRARNNEALAKAGKEKLGHRVMMFAPNVTVTSTDASFNLIHVTGEKSWFKRSVPGEGNLQAELRGYLKTDTTIENVDAWQMVEADGRSVTPAPPTGELDVAELLTKRIQTIELARELWLEKFSLPVYAHMDQPKALGIEHGYRLWTPEDLKRRQEFLSEYARRMETTNLRSIENLLVKLEAAGESPRKVLSGEIYQKALDSYLLGLKKRYTQKKMQIREFNSLEYYVWLLRNGKR